MYDDTINVFLIRSGWFVCDSLQHNAIHVLQHERSVYVLAPNVYQLLAEHGEGGANDAR